MIFSIFATSALAFAADEDPIAQLEAGLGRRRASWQLGYDRWGRAGDDDFSPDREDEFEEGEDGSFEDGDDDFSPAQEDEFEEEEELEERFGTLSEEEAREALRSYMAERAVTRNVVEELARMAYDDNLARGISSDEFDERGIFDTALGWWNNSGFGKKIGNVAGKLWNSAKNMKWGRRRAESNNPILAKMDRLTAKLARHIYENRRYARGTEPDNERMDRAWWDDIWNNVKKLGSDAMTYWNNDPTVVNWTQTTPTKTVRGASRIEERGIEDLIDEARMIQARAERLLEEDREERAVFNDDWYN